MALLLWPVTKCSNDNHGKKEVSEGWITSKQQRLTFSAFTVNVATADAIAL